MDDFDAVDAEQDTPQPKRRYHAIRPVTIRQLAQTKIERKLVRNGRPRPRYSLDGEEFSTATFVGNIISNEVSGETTRTIRIEDGTGKITSTKKIEETEETKEGPPRLRPGVYARVFGVPKEFRGVVTFEVYFIRPVEDYHEVLFHLMEAMVVTLQDSQGQPPKLHDSEFARTAGPPYPPQSQPSPVPPISQVAGALGEESKGSVTTIPPHSPREDTSDDDGGSTEYYTDQPPDSPLERSPSPTPTGAFARNHSYEGHSDREQGSSSQSTQRPEVQTSDEEEEDGRTPRGKFKLRRRDDNVSEPRKKGSDDELDSIRSEFSSQVVPSTPPRLKPDPYSGWSPAKRGIMVFIRSKTLGEEVNVKRSLGEGMSKMEMRNAIRELVKEGEIETVDGINYRLADRGPNYPRF